MAPNTKKHKKTVSKTKTPSKNKTLKKHNKPRTHVLLEGRDNKKVFHHPTIGILSIPMTITKHKYTHSYLPASYVKWIEMNNARVIPIPYDTPHGAMDMILNQVNGVLFVGGQVDHHMINREYEHFMDTFKYIVNHAKKSNNQGNFYPLFSICLGMEILGMMEDSADEVINDYVKHIGISEFDARNYNSKLDVKNTKGEISKIFSHGEISEFRKTPCVFQNHGLGFLLDAPYMKKWGGDWHTVATSKSNEKNPREYVSIFEYKKFPFYGVQFHPEKILFEWRIKEIGRSAIFRDISHKLSRFFITQCKKNKNRVSVDALYIRNYNLWSRSATIGRINPNMKLIKDNKSAFESSYYFDILS